MQKILFTLAAFFYFTVTYAQENLKTIKGKITYLEAPVASADIKILGSDEIFKSATDGSYEVMAKQGDVITFSYPSLRDMRILVEDVTHILNITMSPNVNELDEVVVEASKRRSQRELEEDYLINKDIIKTAYGFLDSNRAAANVRILDESEINTVNVSVSNLLMNRFPGVSKGPGGWISIRGSSSINNDQPAVFDIDGQIFAPISLNNGQRGITRVPEIDIGNIKRIAILNNLASTAQYGSIASGGVIVINTISASEKQNRIIDRARLKNNVYNNDALTSNEVAQNHAIYLKEYNRSNSFEDALQVFEKNEARYIGSPYFYIDSYNHFMDIGEQKFATEMFDRNLPLFERNAVYLKAFAYFAQEHNDLKKANELYEQIFILRPSYSQSYRDLAESYRDIGNYKKAASMYARYNYLKNEGFVATDSTGIFPIMEGEMENLVALEGDKIMEGLKNSRRRAKFVNFEGIRLLFEWNDSEAEFELQFVNPEYHFYTWRHTEMANAELIMNEKLKGYSSEEFLIDSILEGKWQVNINYKGNKKLEPTYLKVTAYYNYGLNSQRKEVNVYRLSLKDVNYELFELVNRRNINTN